MDQSKSKDNQKDVFLPPSLEQAPYSGRVKYAATLLNQKGLTSEFLFKWTQMLLDNKISVEKMRRLNVGDGKVSCADYQLSVPEGLGIDAMKKQLIELSRSFGTDVALQTDNVFRKNKRLVVFDMDSTLIQQEVIDEIARHAGVMDKVAVSSSNFIFIDSRKDCPSNTFDHTSGNHRGCNEWRNRLQGISSTSCCAFARHKH
jgi:hypothetical protein